jgi:mRNA interferase YafQ
LRVRRSSKFKKGYKLAEKQHKDLTTLRTVISKLLRGKKLPRRYEDHKLSGRLKNYREVHLGPDWLLIYRVDKNAGELQLAMLGSHAELYE